MKYFAAVTVIGILSFKIYGDESIPSREISISDLPELLADEENIQSLYEEFEAIENGQRRPWTVAASADNIKKNRYEDLIAFDHSRVLCTLSNDSSENYINANYIDGQNYEKEYVATQGPLPNTINDFWSMIWLLNTTKILMLANVVEHGQIKVEKYWPDVTSTYGDIEVTKLKEIPIPGLQHVLRTFSLRKADSEKPRIIRQFHFTGWPDFGVPKDRLGLLSIIHQTRIYDENKAPIVIHCSAGIGRTGTAILIDSMILRAEADGKVDFPRRLDHMRTLRPSLVEKKEQYLFAHQAVSDTFNDPKTRQRLKDIENLYRLIDALSSSSHEDL